MRGGKRGGSDAGESLESSAFNAQKLAQQSSPPVGVLDVVSAFTFQSLGDAF